MYIDLCVEYPEIYLPKRKLNHCLTKLNNFFSMREKCSKFWFQINNMSHSLETKIQVVILMAKYESPIMVIRELQRRGKTNIPERHSITSIYQKFLKTGSVIDRARTGRPSTITKAKVQEVQQILDNESVNSVRSVARKANISKYQAHQIMRGCAEPA